MKKKENFKRFLILWLGGFVANIGSGITSFGAGIYIFQSSGSVIYKSAITLAAFLPSLILEPFAGVLADRHDRRILMILGDGLSGIVLGFLLLAMFKKDVSLLYLILALAISSIFQALTGPAYEATITDLLDEDEYSKASGFNQLSNASRYLISPVLAGLLMKKSNLKLILLLDISTIIFTMISILFIKKNLKTKKVETKTSFFDDIKYGINTFRKNEALFILTLIMVFLTYNIAFIQELSTPIILGFTDSQELGVIITIAAIGMIVGGVLLSVIKLNQDYLTLLSKSIVFSGLFMVGFGIKESSFIITIFGFLFFISLSFANAAIDFIIRSNISNELQGRLWGLIGTISQLGYLIAYVIIGPLTDFVFTPSLVENGLLTNSVGKVIGIGPGRGAALLVILAGTLLFIFGRYILKIKKLKQLKIQ